jgi:hypothetical protein
VGVGEAASWGVAVALGVGGGAGVGAASVVAAGVAVTTITWGVGLGPQPAISAASQPMMNKLTIKLKVDGFMRASFWAITLFLNLILLSLYPFLASCVGHILR